MAEYIDRDALIDEIYGLMNPDSSDIVNKIYAQPSIDAMEVIRCKDCKYWDREHISVEGSAKCITGENGVRYRTSQDFCSSGVKKNEIN